MPIATDLVAALEDAPSMRLPGAVLMGDPHQFDVVAQDNPHMADAAGRPHVVDKALAAKQWLDLHDAYRSAGLAVEVLKGHAGADQCFVRNAAACGEVAGKPVAMSATMRHTHRQLEVAELASWLAAHHHDVHAAGPAHMEGGGDLIWVPGKRLLLGGHGPRTDPAALPRVGEVFDCDVVPVPLHDPFWYHLDTSLAFMGSEHVLVAGPGLPHPIRKALSAAFHVVDVAAKDLYGMPANAHCPDGKHVFIDAAYEGTIRNIEKAGFDAVPVDTSEFRKSGGSVFCLTLDVWQPE